MDLHMFDGFDSHDDEDPIRISFWREAFYGIRFGIRKGCLIDCCLIEPLA